MTTRSQTSSGGARRIRARVLTGVAAAGMLATVVSPVAAQTVPGGGTSPLVTVDEQNWVDMEDLTWDDYVPVPNARPEYYEYGTEGRDAHYRTAVILLDFEDQPFLITQEPESHPFGNPQPGHEPVADEDVNQWFYEYFAVPNEYNMGHTISSYWLETTHGEIGVEVEVFGPYTLPGKIHEYGYDSFNSPMSTFCPEGDNCGKNIRTDGGRLWREDIGCSSGLCGFDNGFYVTAGHDESSTWQEFGEMLFETPQDIPDEFGPPGAAEGNRPNDQNGNPIPNWANTRYVDWTSWQAAANHWPNASGGTSTQAESSGLSVYAHEFSHLRGLPDNYNNPFADNIRNYTGYWEMMSRGTFNGPGGTHNRWQVPNVGGSALGPHHTLHYKNQMNALRAEDQVTVNRGDLTSEGIATVTLQARSSVPEAPVGFTVNFGSNVNLNAQCRENDGLENFYCPPGSNWQHYRFEVVDRVGNDSFVPGHGVLINASRNSGTPRVWMLDPNPQDIDMVDFYRPDGTPVMVVRGDPRQLNDATFHAGTNSGSEFEYVDETSRLHLYVLDTFRDDEGVLHYDVAARHLDGAGDFDRDVTVDAPEVFTVGKQTALVQLGVTNTGEAGEGLFDSDIYRVEASVDGAGWEVFQPYEVYAASAGEALDAAVYVTRSSASAGAATLTVTVTSESDSSVSETVTVPLDASTVELSAASVSAVIDLYADELGHANTTALKARVRAYFAARAGAARDRVLEQFERDVEQIEDEVAYAALRSIYETMRGLR